MKSKILLVIFLFISLNSFSTTYSSIASGDWSNTDTWGGSIPPTTPANGDIININSGHTVSLGSTLTANNNFELNIAGDFTINGDFDVHNNVTLIITGTFTLNGNFTGNNNAVIDITGDLDITGDCTLDNGADIDVDGSLNIGGDFTGGANCDLTGTGEVNVDGSVTGIDDSGYNGEVNESLAPPVGLTNYGSVIHVGTSAVIYIDGDANGNYTNRAAGGNNGRIDLDGTIIVEGNWNNNTTTDSIFINIDDNGLVSLKGSTTQNIGGSQPSSFEKLLINNSNDSVIMDENVIINESLTLTNGIIYTGTDTVIILNNDVGAIISQSSGNSINGNLRRYMTAAEFSFPLSTSTQYLEAIVNITTINLLTYMECKFTESSSETIPDGLNVDGTPITAFLDYGYWTFTPDNGTDVVYDITLTSSGHTNGGIAANQHAVFKRISGSDPWESVGTHSNLTQSGTGTDPITAKRTNVTGFSDFIIGKGDNPLLTELITFYANCIDEKIEILWQTASEENNDYFTLEKSRDGINFTNLAEIDGAGNSNQLINYEFTDSKPYYFTTYYRLKQTDYNGISIFSDIISSTCNSISFELIGTLYQNENGIIRLFIVSELEDDYIIELFDILGRKLITEKYNAQKGENTFALETSSIASDIYFITISNNTDKISRKIFIR